ncbi:hypothetical protein RRG08_014586 [Elysia crispata]|uniref:Uncharacterized protein n=1 Tax=Elysia crispata TaxID=231223 RepID=A0AAE1EEP3_9GAST|nr:hypothetical protein RRG08_014586 [Elysia crispata]
MSNLEVLLIVEWDHIDYIGNAILGYKGFNWLSLREQRRSVDIGRDRFLSVSIPLITKTVHDEILLNGGPVAQMKFSSYDALIFVINPLDLGNVIKMSFIIENKISEQNRQCGRKVY